MHKFTQFIMIGATGVALTACGSSSSNNDTVNFAQLVDTGLNGYKLNVTLDFDVAEDPTTSIDYYFCTDAVNVWDFYAYSSDNPDEPIQYEPDFDYGVLSIPASGVLLFDENANAPTPYVVLSEDETLTEGQTYTMDAENSDYAGTVRINTISEFTCPTVEPM